MKLAGDYILDAPRELVWSALLDPDVLSKTLPGCEDLREVGENQYQGRLKMKVGPVQGVFEGEVQLSNLDAPNSYDLAIEGKGAPGFMNGNGTLTLADDPGGTKLSYAIEAQVGGRIASIGQRLVESSAKVITKQGLKGLDQQVQEIKQRVESLAADEPREPLSEAEAKAAVDAGDPGEADAMPTARTGHVVAASTDAASPSLPSPNQPVTPAASARVGRAIPVILGLVFLAIAAFFIIQRGCA